MEKTHVKFCGITQREDLEVAIELGADFIGMIFYQQSPRYITPLQAKKICSGLDFKHTRKVGVFVNSPLQEILSIIATVKLEVIQLHGDQSIEHIQEIRKYTDIVIWKTVRVKNLQSIEIVRQTPMEYFLIDTFSHRSYGGTGKQLDLKMVESCCALQDPENKKIIVAGGLHHENIDTVLPFSPWGVDINSGVEANPGIKSHRLMKKLIQAIEDYNKPEPT